MSLAYQGNDQGGIPRQGTIATDDPREVIRRFWPHGWRTLRVTAADGEVVGVIGMRKGRRCWGIASTEEPT